jgi:hypothetical protein
MHVNASRDDDKLRWRAIPAAACRRTQYLFILELSNLSSNLSYLNNFVSFHLLVNFQELSIVELVLSITASFKMAEA